MSRNSYNRWTVVLTITVSVFLYTELAFAQPPLTPLVAETPGEKIYSKTGTFHGLAGSHTLARYFSYPSTWPKVYRNTEVNYDARDAWESVGEVWSIANCTDTLLTTQFSDTENISFTVSRSGSLSTEIASALQWPGSGSISLGGSASINWEVSGTVTGTYTISSAPPYFGIPAQTVVFRVPACRFAYRQGTQYEVVQGSTSVWCSTHGTWLPSSQEALSIVDYKTDTPPRAETKYVAEDRLIVYSKSPCSSNCPPLEELTYDIDRVFPVDPCMFWGYHWLIR